MSAPRPFRPPFIFSRRFTIFNGQSNTTRNLAEDKSNNPKGVFSPADSKEGGDWELIRLPNGRFVMKCRGAPTGVKNGLLYAFPPKSPFRPGHGRSGDFPGEHDEFEDFPAEDDESEDPLDEQEEFEEFFREPTEDFFGEHDKLGEFFIPTHDKIEEWNIIRREQTGLYTIDRAGVGWVAQGSNNKQVAIQALSDPPFFPANELWNIIPARGIRIRRGGGGRGGGGLGGGGLGGGGRGGGGLGGGGRGGRPPVYGSQD